MKNVIFSFRNDITIHHKVRSRSRHLLLQNVVFFRDLQSKLQKNLNPFFFAENSNNIMSSTNESKMEMNQQPAEEHKGNYCQHFRNRIIAQLLFLAAKSFSKTQTEKTRLLGQRIQYQKNNWRRDLLEPLEGFVWNQTILYWLLMKKEFINCKRKKHM